MMTNGRRANRWAAGCLALLLLAGCAAERRVDPTAIDRPAAERLTEGEVVQILTSMSRFRQRSYAVLAERTAVESAREVAREILAEEAGLARGMAAVGSRPASHRLARSIADREASLPPTLPSSAGAPATASYLRGLIQQERWFVILIDNTLMPSAESTALQTYLGDARAAAAANLQRLRALRAQL